LGGGDKDAFVAKLSPDGASLVYSTYLGGSSWDWGSGIAVDSSGSAYVTGTASTNFPTVNAYQKTFGGVYYDAFVTKLSPAGNTLTYSTYLGGSGWDDGYSIAVDSSGSAYVTGDTASTNFPTTNAYQGTYGGGSYDVFVTKISPAGNTLTYSTYLGGSGWDGGYSIAVDSSGSAYVTGDTDSTDFPTNNAYQGTYGGGDEDIFVTKLSPSGNTLTYSTYLGGSVEDWGSGIALDSSENAYVTGVTASTNFPTVNAYQETYGGGYYDAFVTKLSPAGNTLSYSTYLGGSDYEDGNAIAVDSSGNAYVTGDTASTDFPTNNAYQGTYEEGFGDVFVTKFGVPQTVAGPGDGTGWDKAFKTIQAAIDAAGKDDEIWLKKGAYELSSQVNVDKAVAVYGGFAGGETQRDQRDWSGNVTTVDGQGSVYHCFYVTADATIDGLFITGGNADGNWPDSSGGGIFNDIKSSPTITNCTFSGNSADSWGGGIFNNESSPTITNCTFLNNSTTNYHGGGIYNYNMEVVSITMKTHLLLSPTAPSGETARAGVEESLTMRPLLLSKTVPFWIIAQPNVMAAAFTTRCPLLQSLTVPSRGIAQSYLAALLVIFPARPPLSPTVRFRETAQPAGVARFTTITRTTPLSPTVSFGVILQQLRALRSTITILLPHLSPTVMSRVDMGVRAISMLIHCL
jgi:hypothetical protein